MSGLTVSAIGEIGVQDNVQFIECDVRNVPCVVYLPTISSRESFVDRKFYVNDFYENAGKNNITIVAPNGYKVNSQQSIILQSNGISALIVISGIKDYIATVSISSSSISIPTTIIKVGVTNNTYNMSNLFAYYLPTQNNDFLNYNPKYYLFMAKSKTNHKKRVNGVPTKMKRLAGFYHPTHQNGINFPTGSKFYSGYTAIPLDSEFSLTPNPYTLTQIGFNPFQWSRVQKGIPFSWQVPDLSDINSTIIVDKFKIQGKNQAKGKRSALFSIAIGIQNPDTTSDNPILFGELSQPFKFTFKVRTIGIVAGLVNGFRLAIQTTNIHRRII